jgi:acyl-coenzyme A synthetase/AMP-(fatty) acid ligase
MAKFKTPTYVEFIKELPRNAAGKVMKKELRYIPGQKADEASQAG